MADTALSVFLEASDRSVWSGRAKYVIVPAESGEMGFLPGHDPLLALLSRGTVQVTDMEGVVHKFAVDDGFVSFDNNKVVIAVDSGTPLEGSGEARESSHQTPEASAGEASEKSAGKP